METPEDLTPRHVLQGQALMDYLVERAAERAKDAIIDRDERRKRVITLVFSSIALLGISGLVSIFKIYVRSELDVFDSRLTEASLALDKKLDKKADLLVLELQKQVSATVELQISDSIGAVKKVLDEDDLVERYVELAFDLPEKLNGIHERGDKYVTEKLGEVVQAAEQMEHIKEMKRRRRRFLMSTRQIIDVMSRFNRETEINRMDDLFGDVMASDQELAHTLVDHYGQLVVGSPRPVEAQADNMARLQRYMQAARDLSYPEKALVWAVFVEFKRNNFTDNSTVRSLLESSDDLQPDDRAEFWYNLLVYTDRHNWMLAPDQQGKELERLMAALQRTYPEITRVMEDNIVSNDYLQARLANLRDRSPASRPQPLEQQAPMAAPMPEPPTVTASEAPAEVAEAPTGDNTLRQ
jgi:hypothetical protein